MGCLRARTSEGAALFRAVTTSLPRCPCQNTEARSRAWAPALQQAGLNPGAQGRGWPGWGQEGGYRKTVHPRTGAKRHPRMCWSVCPEGNTNTGASPSRPCIQMSGVDSGLPQSAGLGCRVWEPQAGWGRVHTAWGKAPWRRGGSVGSPKVGGIGVEGDVCSRGEPRAMVKQARSPSGDLEAPPRGQRAERAGEAGPEQPCCSAPPLPHAGLL